MSDKGGPTPASRLKMELEVEEHQDTIARGQARLAAIDRQKVLNLRRAELQNIELDEEADTIRANESSLKKKIGDIEGNLDAMAKT